MGEDHDDPEESGIGSTDDEREDTTTDDTDRPEPGSVEDATDTTPSWQDTISGTDEAPPTPTAEQRFPGVETGTTADREATISDDEAAQMLAEDVESDPRVSDADVSVEDGVFVIESPGFETVELSRSEVRESIEAGSDAQSDRDLRARDTGDGFFLEPDRDQLRGEVADERGVDESEIEVFRDSRGVLQATVSDEAAAEELATGTPFDEDDFTNFRRTDDGSVEADIEEEARERVQRQEELDASRDRSEQLLRDFGASISEQRLETGESSDAALDPDVAQQIADSDDSAEIRDGQLVIQREQEDLESDDDGFTILARGEDFPGSVEEALEVRPGEGDQLFETDLPTNQLEAQMAVRGTARSVGSSVATVVATGPTAVGSRVNDLELEEEFGTAEAATAATAVAVPEPGSTAVGGAALIGAGAIAAGEAGRGRVEIDAPETAEEADPRVVTERTIPLESGSDVTELESPESLEDAQPASTTTVEAPETAEETAPTSATTVEMPEEESQDPMVLETQTVTGVLREEEEVDDDTVVVDDEPVTIIDEPAEDTGQLAREQHEQQIWEQEQEFGEEITDSVPQQEGFDEVDVNDIEGGISGQGEPQQAVETGETFAERFQRIAEESLEDDTFIGDSGLRDSPTTSEPASELESGTAFEQVFDAPTAGDLSGSSPATGTAVDEGADTASDAASASAEAELLAELDAVSAETTGQLEAASTVASTPAAEVAELATQPLEDLVEPASSANVHQVGQQPPREGRGVPAGGIPRWRPPSREAEDLEQDDPRGQGSIEEDLVFDTQNLEDVEASIFGESDLDGALDDLDRGVF
ncbi:hypothetical protein ACFSUP_04390 [Gracilibacillus thailandensis]